MIKQAIKLGLIGFGVLMFSILPGCAEEDEETNQNGSGGDAPPLFVESYAAGEEIPLSFETGNEEYNVIAYWTAEEDATVGFTISEAGGGSEAVAKQKRAILPARPAWMPQARYRKLQRRFLWDNKMRRFEKQLLAEGLLGEHLIRRIKRAKLSAECGALEVARGDECLNELELGFKDFDGEVTDITVEIKAKGEHCAVAVDVDDSVSQEQIDQVVRQFDNVIYPRNHFIYGETVFDGSDYTDRDQDGLHLIVMTSLVNDSGAVGFFNPGDFVGQPNTSDILWVVVPDAQNPLESVFGTVAHEYLHLMVFGVKFVKHRVDESLWLNESMAHLAEDASGYGIDNIDTVALYLESANDYTWAYSGDDVEARGMGFLFLRYLFEQKGAVSYDPADGSKLTDNGGASFLRDLLATSDTGFSAVDKALGGDWSEHFFSFLAAVSRDTTGAEESAEYSFKDPYTDPISGQQIGVCTNCTRKNAMGQSVPFTGPAAQSFSGEFDGVITATGSSTVRITASDAQRLTTDADDDVRFGVVRVK